ncbi:MAG: hypothetical protein AAF907_18420, partial [Planctomycetota bacterium]
LCRAFDGDHKAAVGALNKAAEQESDFEAAVELETIAQLLELTDGADRIALKERIYAPANVAKLLSDLDDHDRFHRLPEHKEEAVRPDAVYELLDRPMPADDAGLTADTVPNVVAELSIFNESDPDRGDGGPRAVLSSFEGDEWDAAATLIEQIDLPEAAETEQPAGSEADGLPRELWNLRWRWAFPDDVPLRRRRELEGEEWTRRIHDVWPQTPLAALSGKTPAEAADDESAARPLAAALYVLDAVCDRGRYELNLNGLRSRFGLPAIEPQPAPENAQLNAYSILHLQRTDLSRLDDRQLITVLNRVLLVHPSRFLRATLTEALGRESLADQFD